MLNSSLRKNAEIHLHTTGALKKYIQALEICSRAAFEEVMMSGSNLSEGIWCG